MQFTPSQQQIIKNILNNYNKLKYNFETIDTGFTPLVLGGHTDQELRDFNETIIRINRALESVKRWIDRGGSGYGNSAGGTNNPMFPAMFGGGF